MKRVNILLSTYNGQQYIRRQLDSLVKQTYPNIKLYVRDDGSKDDTISIVQEYIQLMDIELIRGKNMGFLKSFLYLLQYANEGDYWAFCDQDDWWHEDKVACAVKWLDSQNQDIPLLYHSAYEVVDEQGVVSDVFYFKENGYDFRRSITENHFSGFSMVVNRMMRDKLLRCNPEQIDYHDWFAAMIVTAFGVYRSDERVLAKYYRYNESVSRITFGKKITWFVRMLKSKSDIRKRAEEFYRIYRDELTEENKQVAELFVIDKYDLKKSIIKVFYPKRWRPNISSEIFLRILMLLGRI